MHPPCEDPAVAAGQTALLDPTSLEAHFQVAAEAGSGKGHHHGAALGQAVWQELLRRPQ